MTDIEIFETAGRWFDPAWYLLRNPDVARVAIAPLAHYLRYGENEGRKPSRWFDPAWYRMVYDVEADQSPLGHFLTHRASGGFLPCPALYLAASWPAPDDGDDRFDRYLTEHEIVDRELLPDLTVIEPSGLIGSAYHRINGSQPHEAELDPALHYCRIGWRTGLWPGDAFDPVWYAGGNPAVARLGINPLTHYIMEGEAANQRPIPWFDPGWYRGRYGIAANQLSLAHYLAHRHDRIVSPNPLFDTPWYTVHHGDAIPPEIDPFSHYLLWGAVRDIDPSPSFSARDWRHRHMAPVSAPDQHLSPVAARNPLVHFLSMPPDADRSTNRDVPAA